MDDGVLLVEMRGEASFETNETNPNPAQWPLPGPTGSEAKTGVIQTSGTPITEQWHRPPSADIATVNGDGGARNINRFSEVMD